MFYPKTRKLNRFQILKLIVIKKQQKRQDNIHFVYTQR